MFTTLGFGVGRGHACSRDGSSSRSSRLFATSRFLSHRPRIWPRELHPKPEPEPAASRDVPAAAGGGDRLHDRRTWHGRIHLGRLRGNPDRPRSRHPALPEIQPRRLAWSGRSRARGGSLFVASAVTLALHAVPPTVGVAGVVDPIPGTGEVVISGEFALFHPSSGADHAGYAERGATTRLWIRKDSTVKIDAEYGRTPIPGTGTDCPVPAGVRTGPFRFRRRRQRCLPPPGSARIGVGRPVRRGAVQGSQPT